MSGFMDKVKKASNQAINLGAKTMLKVRLRAKVVSEMVPLE
jgi:hypothetical protein